MLRFLPFVFALASILSVSAQQAVGYLSGNNIVCRTTATGDLFNPFEELGQITFEVPAGSGLNSIYAANLWVAGVTSDQQIKLSAETYQADGQDWFTGPLQSNGTLNTDPDTEDHFNRVWVANAAEVLTHMAYFQALQNGTVEIEFPNGYSMPEWIQSWPGTPNVDLGFAPYMAPYMDFNSNGIYDPENGDYPYFCGDNCLYFIFNDSAHPHTETGGERIGLEVHAMLYNFDDENNPMLQNTVFLKYRIANVGTQTIHDTHIGLWVDFDLGNNFDDFVGTNVKRSAIYAYNGDDMDEASTGSLGYGAAPPMQAFQVLAGPMMDADGIDNELPDLSQSGETGSYGDFALGFGDGLVDNERLGLSSSMYYNLTNNTQNGSPSSAIGYLNYLNHFYLDGTPIVHPGTDIPTDYFFPGQSDPLHLGTDGTDVPLWDETTAGNAPGDRRMLAVCGPFTFQPQARHTLDGAFVFAADAGGGMDVAGIMDERLRQSKIYFSEHLVTCQAPSLITHVAEADKAVIEIFPNPATEFIQINTQECGELLIFDQYGKLVKRTDVLCETQKMDISDLSTGLYMLQWKTEAGMHVEKLIVE